MLAQFEIRLPAASVKCFVMYPNTRLYLAASSSTHLALKPTMAELPDMTVGFLLLPESSWSAQVLPRFRVKTDSGFRESTAVSEEHGLTEGNPRLFSLVLQTRSDGGLPEGLVFPSDGPSQKARKPESQKQGHSPKCSELLAQTFGA